MNFNIKPVYRDILILLLISFILVLVWFQGGELFSGAEESLSFYNYSRTSTVYSSLWQENGAGYKLILNLAKMPYFSFGAIFFSIGVPSLWIQSTTFFVIIFGGMVSIYFLVRTLLSSKIDDSSLERMAIGAAIFYMFNPFAMSQIWGRGLSFLIFGFCLVPLFLLCYVLSIYKNSVWLTVGLIASLVFSTTYSNPALIITSWFSICLFTVYSLIVYRHNKFTVYKIFRNFCIYLIGWILIQGFWLFPYLSNGNALLNVNLSARNNIESMKGLAVNSGLFNVLRLWHREYYDGTYPIWYYKHFFVIFMSVFNLFILFCSYFLIKYVRWLKFFWIVLVCSVFVCIGYNFPTGDLLIRLFETVTPLQVLRNPYEKFGLNLILAYAILWGIGLVVFAEFLRKKWGKLSDLIWFASILYVVIGLCWPYWDRSFAGGDRSSFWINIPDYYGLANTWLNGQADDKRILQLPLSIEDGVTYTWNKPFNGIEGSEYLFDKSSISRNTGLNNDYYNRLLELIGGVGRQPAGLFLSENDYFSDNSFASMLDKLNIGFIILRHDVNTFARYSASIDHTHKFIESQPNINKVAHFGELGIYKVESTASAKLIYSPDLEVDYLKLTNTYYQVKVTSSGSKYGNLYFLSKFDSGWKLFVNGDQLEDHYKIFSYANSWKASLGPNDNIEIIYEPQLFVDLGIKSSRYTTLFIMVYITGYLIRKGRRKHSLNSIS